MKLEKITTIEELQNQCITENCNYIIGYYDIVSKNYINYDVFRSPIDCIRNLSKYLEIVHIPLKDIELRLIGYISDNYIFKYGKNEEKIVYILDPVMYFKDIYKEKEVEKKEIK